MTRLQLGLRLQDARRHLDVLLELLHTLLPSVGDNILRDQFEERLRDAERAVATRHHLRLVKGLR